MEEVGHEPEKVGGLWDLGNSPRFIASKDTKTSVLPLQGTEFHQQPE